MRIHVGQVELVQKLIRYFEEQADCVVLQVGRTEIEVSLLGSYDRDVHTAAVERLLADFWMKADGGERNGGPEQDSYFNGDVPPHGLSPI